MEEKINVLFYKKDDLEKNLANLEEQFSRISTLRIVSFLVGIIFCALGVSDGINAFLWVGLLMLGIFLYLVKMHGIITTRTEIAKSKQLVINRYISRYSDDWRDFDEDGKEFLGENDTVASDIDLLGKNSLYQMISVCHTKAGKRILADAMKKLDYTEDLANRQEAIKELMDNVDFLVEYEAAGVRLEKQKKKFDVDEFTSYCCNKAQGVLPKWVEALAVIVPIVQLAIIVLVLMGMLNYGAIILGFIIVLGFSWLMRPITDAVIAPVYGVSYVAEDYYAMLKQIDKKEFESKLLNKMKNNISGEAGAIKAFAKLSQISQAYNVSFNPLIHQILSGFILWDFQLARIVRKWKMVYGHNTAESFKVIGELEMLMSLSVVGIVRETSWAQINKNAPEGKVKFDCVDMYHPLLKPETVVANSATLSNGITIITGSNMSGKTTFLRTMAINLALSYMGAPVCAKSITSDYMKIFTSMRIADDVANGISTFYAEILRIKAMADYKNSHKVPMLCMIDEIFKGTNSADRIVGAKEVIRRLSGGKNSMTIVSTHDFELCDIKDTDNNSATNYHFEEYYEDDVLKFDYKIKDGRCTTTNAKAILRMAGFNV